MVLPKKIHFQDLNEEQISEIKEAFSLLEDLNTKTVSSDDLELLLRLVGLKPSVKFTQSMLSKLDPENKGRLTLQQFLVAARKGFQKEPTFDDLVKIAEAFDGDKDGYLTVIEVKELICNGGEKLGEPDVHDILEELFGENADLKNKELRVQVEIFVTAVYHYK